MPRPVVHLAFIGAVWTGLSAFEQWLCLGPFVSRMFFVTAGCNRRLSHNSDRTSRAFRRVKVTFAGTSSQDLEQMVPPLLMAVSVKALFGTSALLIGFFLSTVQVEQGTFCINSLAHRIGRRRYETGEESRNSALLALITLPEGGPPLVMPAGLRMVRARPDLARAVRPESGELGLQHAAAAQNLRVRHR